MTNSNLAGFELAYLRTEETITPEQAVRGLRKLLPVIDSRRDKERQVSRPVLAFARLALLVTQPIRTALWWARLEAEMWIYGVKR